MSAKPKTQTVEERRDDDRVDLDGAYSIRLDPCDGRAALTCEVLDFSVTGVRLKLPGNVALPPDVQVMIGDITHDARVVWRKDDVVGVDLIDEHHSLY
jgi:PilZ domain-containing protein